MYNDKITKRINGICEVIKKIISEKRIERVEQPSKKTYFSWPTIHEIHEFRKNGGRLI